MSLAGWTRTLVEPWREPERFAARPAPGALRVGGFCLTSCSGRARHLLVEDDHVLLVDENWVTVCDPTDGHTRAAVEVAAEVFAAKMLAPDRLVVHARREGVANQLDWQFGGVRSIAGLSHGLPELEPFDPSAEERRSRLVRRLGHQPSTLARPLAALAFSPCGQWLATEEWVVSAQDGSLRTPIERPPALQARGPLGRVATPRVQVEFDAAGEAVWQLWPLGEGGFALASVDPVTGVRTRRTAPVLEHAVAARLAPGASHLVVWRQGRRAEVLAPGDEETRVWKEHASPAGAAPRPDAVGPGARLWCELGSTGIRVAGPDLPTAEIPKPASGRAVWSLDGGTLAVISGEGIRIFSVDVATRHIGGDILIRFDDSEVTGLALCAAGRYLVFGNRHGEVGAFDLRRERALPAWPGHPGPVVEVAVAPDGARFASRGAEGTVVVWDRARLEEAG